MADISEFILNKLDKLDEKLDDIKVQNASTEAAMRAHEDKDEERHLDVVQMSGQLKHQSILLSEYNESLKEHIRRTELLEKRVDATDLAVAPIVKEYNDQKVYDDIKSSKWKKAAKILGLLATVAGIAAAIAEMWQAGWFH